jgi:hypothetical protein
VIASGTPCFQMLDGDHCSPLQRAAAPLPRGKEALPPGNEALIVARATTACGCNTSREHQARSNEPRTPGNRATCIRALTLEPALSRQVKRLPQLDNVLRRSS